MKPRQISELCQRRNLCSRQRPPFSFFQDDVLIGCRISFLTTSSSEIEVCFFGAVCIGLSVVRDVLAAVVSLCQTCPFGYNRYKMLVQKVFAKKSRRSCRICLTSKSIRAESTSSTIRSAKNTRSRYLDLTKISIALFDLSGFETMC